MSRTKQEKPKALVLEAFDTFFNKRNYVTVERYWSPHYIQNSAHIEPGREGPFNLIESLPDTLRYEACLAVCRRRLRYRIWSFFRVWGNGELDRG